jgi:hypothetical protein
LGISLRRGDSSAIRVRADSYSVVPGKGGYTYGDPASFLRVSPDVSTRAPADDARMSRPSYAVTWREDDGPRYAGKLEFAPERLRLQGRAAADDQSRRTISYSEVVGIAVVRANEHRVLAVALDCRRALRIDSLGGPGSLTELVGELRTRTQDERP